MIANFTLGAESANARKVTVQLGSRSTRGGKVRNVGGKRALRLYLSSDAAGDTVVNPTAVAVVPTDGGAGSLLQAHVASEQPIFEFKTDDTGKLEVTLTNATDANVTTYLNVIDPASGKVVTSGAIAFADDTP